MKFHISLICLSLCSTFLKAQNPVRVDNGKLSPNETSMCINRVNPANLIGGSNINQIYTTLDTGITWKQYGAQSTFGVYGDPVLMCNREGRIYYAHLSKNQDKKWPEWFDRIVVQYSTDGGEIFSKGASVGHNEGKMQDKPWLYLDEWPNSPQIGKVFVSWTEFDRYKSADSNHHSRIQVAFSGDGGVSFSTPVTVSDSSGSCLDDDNSTEGATTASLPDGTLCMAWSAFGKIWFDQSHDGGKTWGTDRAVADQSGGWEMDIKGIYRANGFPFLTVDKSDGPHKGRLYIFYGDSRLGDADEWLIHSDDRGKTWSAPVRLNTDAPANGRDQFLGHFAVDAENGNWYALFYDQRYGKGPEELDLTLAWGNDSIVYNRRLTPESFPAPGKNVFFGDYISIDAYKQQIVPCWTAFHKNLGIYMLHLRHENLTPHSDDKQSLSIKVENNQIILNYTSGVNGTIALSGKRWKIFRTRQIIKFDTGADISEQKIIPVNPRKFQIAHVRLFQPGTSLMEQSAWEFKKK